MRKAYGYVRGRKFDGKWTQDSFMQRDEIQNYCEALGYELVDVVFEEQRLRAGKGRLTGLNAKFRDTLSKAEEFDAVLIYIKLERWRRNQLFNQYVAAMRTARRGTPSRNRYLHLEAIDPTSELIESIERQARLEVLMDKRGVKKTKAKKKLTPIQLWQQMNAVSTKRLKNFQHLAFGVKPIYQILRMDDVKCIQKELKQNYYVTVDGKQWSTGNIRKAKELVRTELFNSFLQVKEAEKKNTF